MFKTQRAKKDDKKSFEYYIQIMRKSLDHAENVWFVQIYLLRTRRNCARKKHIYFRA